MIRAISRALLNVESLSRALPAYFEPLYTNMYHVGPSDGAVLRHTLRLEIYEVVSVETSLFHFFNLLQVSGNGK